MHEKRFDGKSEELRSPERIAVLEVKTVIDLVLQDVQADSVLDVGTGSGLFAEAFHKQGLEAACVDVSQDMLDLAKQHLPEADLRLGKAEALPFPDGYCDLVFLGHVLHETDVPLRALKEARRVGRKRTAVLEWRYDESNISFGPPRAHRLARDQVRVWCEQAGFVRFESYALTHMMLYLMSVA